MPKSKPKRVNWKQRALHCEEVIKIQNQVANASQFYWGTAKQYVVSRDGTEYWPRAEMNRKIEEYLKRAELAEKQNALLLEEREARAVNRTVCSGCHLPYCHGECFTPVRFHGDKKLFEIGDVVETPEGTFTIGDPANPPQTEPAPTHWQRFKSFLQHWYVELLCIAFILCVTAGVVALVYAGR